MGDLTGASERLSGLALHGCGYFRGVLDTGPWLNWVGVRQGMVVIWIRG